MTQEEFDKLRQRATQKPKWIVAIDPDVTKSGLAILNTRTREIIAKSLTFPEVLHTIYALHNQTLEYNEKYKVYIEAGWLNKSNWHLRQHDNARIAAAKGNATGRNHQVGRTFVEIFEYANINHEAIKPLKKCWQGKDGKITQTELEYIVGDKLPRMNQDARDAVIIAWQMADFPIHMKPTHHTPPNKNATRK